MKRLKNLSVFALVVMLSLSACSDDDSNSCQNGSLEMTINGDHVTGSSFDNTLLKGNDGGVEGKRMDIRATDASGRMLIITISDRSTGASGNGISTDEYVSMSEIDTGMENIFFFTIVDGDVSYSFVEGSLDITSCDENAKQISGTFSFSDGEFVVTNGSFTDLCYRIVK